MCKMHLNKQVKNQEDKQGWRCRVQIAIQVNSNVLYTNFVLTECKTYHTVLYTQQLVDFVCIIYPNGYYFIWIHCLSQANLSIWWWDAGMPLSINRKGEFHSARGKESRIQNRSKSESDVAPMEKTRALRHDESIVWTLCVCLSPSDGPCYLSCLNAKMVIKLEQSHHKSNRDWHREAGNLNVPHWMIIRHAQGLFGSHREPAHNM